jgi:hypothetical protein
MNAIAKGILAGLTATAVLSVLMIIKSMMGIMPELDIMQMLSSMMGASSSIPGWMAHFAIGALGYGVAFVLLFDKLPGASLIVRGIALGVAGWLLMMVAVMPMAGAGLFGLRLGMPAPVLTLVLHVIFGAALGATYAKLVQPSLA